MSFKKGASVILNKNMALNCYFPIYLVGSVTIGEV